MTRKAERKEILAVYRITAYDRGMSLYKPDWKE
jgi:hypothetical protein